LGSKDYQNARQIVILGVAFDFAYGVLAGAILLFALRPIWGIIYTDDPQVRESVYACMPVMFVYTVVDATKCVCLNILRSTGRPAITVYGNIIVCLFVMLPVGYMAALKLGGGIVGLWLAMSLAWLLATVVYLVVLMKTDWEKQSIIASGDAKKALVDSH
jgi:MATE family multidrug resistance protein